MELLSDFHSFVVVQAKPMLWFRAAFLLISDVQPLISQADCNILSLFRSSFYFLAFAFVCITVSLLGHAHYHRLTLSRALKVEIEL